MYTVILWYNHISIVAMEMQLCSLCIVEVHTLLSTTILKPLPCIHKHKYCLLASFPQCIKENAALKYLYIKKSHAVDFNIMKLKE
jgi:hypothetical protein